MPIKPVNLSWVITTSGPNKADPRIGWAVIKTKHVKLWVAFVGKSATTNCHYL
jgi:hypothetical protein